MELARAGDAEAFGVLVRRYQNAAYANALSHIRGMADAEDVVQEAFVVAWCKLGQLRDAGGFGSWFRRIVTSESLQWLRRQRPEATRRADVAVESLGTESAHQDARLSRFKLWQEVFALPEHYRTAALLFYLSGFSYDEIAGFLEVPVSTVKGRLQQARFRLKKSISPAELEGLQMSQTDISEEVQELIYQIATQRIEETVQMGETKNVVLFFGVTASVEVRRADGDSILIEGSRASMALSDKAARRSAAAIAVQVDEVEDFVTAGPHPGEIFVGTSTSDNSKPVAQSTPSSDNWTAFRDGIGESTCGLRTSEAFPNTDETFTPELGEQASCLKEAIRISIQREKMEALTLPRSLYSEHFSSVLQVNHTSDDHVQGPVGRVDVTVYLPARKSMTVINAETVACRDAEADLVLINCRGCDIERHQGSAHLLNTPLDRAVEVEGDLYQRFHFYGGVSYAGDRVKRDVEYRSNLECVTGDIDIDVGDVGIEASRLSGRVRLRNRYGHTHLSVQADSADTPYSLDTTSGTIKVNLAKGMIPEFKITALTLCGTIDYAALYGIEGRQTANNRQLAVITTARGEGKELLCANLVAKAASGDISFKLSE